MRYILEDTILRFTFNTRRFTTGAPFALGSASTPACQARAEDSVTPITTGFTLSVDYNGVTGLNHVAIDLSVDAGFVADKMYYVTISNGTVDGVSVVGTKVYEFFIVAGGGMEDLITRGLLGVPAAAPGANGGSPTVDANNRIAGMQGVKHTFDDLNDLDAAGIRDAVGLAAANLDAQLAAIAGHIDTEIGSIIASLAALNNLSQADVRSAVGLAAPDLDAQIATLATAAKLLAYVQLMTRKDAAAATDNAAELAEINADGGSGPGGYLSTSDSQEAIRDAGGGGGGAGTNVSVKQSSITIKGSSS